MLFTKSVAVGLLSLLSGFEGCVGRRATGTASRSHSPIESTIIEYWHKNGTTFQYRVCDAPQQLAETLAQRQFLTGMPSCKERPSWVDFYLVSGESANVIFNPNKRFSNEMPMGHFIGDKTQCNLPNGVCMYDGSSPEADRLRKEFGRVVMAFSSDTRLYHDSAAGHEVAVVCGKVLVEQYASHKPL